MRWVERNPLMALVIFFGLILFILFYIIYLDSKKPTIEIKKSDWTCTRSHKGVVHSGFMSGKGWIPTTNYVTVCDEYKRN